MSLFTDSDIPEKRGYYTKLIRSERQTTLIRKIRATGQEYNINILIMIDNNQELKKWMLN